MTFSLRHPLCSLRVLPLLMILALAYCDPLHADSLNGNKTPKHVTVVLHCDYSPVSFLDRTTGSPSGFFVDIMNIIAARSGLQISYLCRNGWDDMITAIDSGDADLGALMKSSEREKKLLFSMPPIETSYLSYFARTQSDVDPSASPSGYSVGAIKGSMSHERLKSMPGAKLHLYGSYREGLFGLLAGEITIFAGEESMVLKQIHETSLEDRIKKVGKPFVERHRCLVMRKDNVQLLDLMNKTLDDFVGGPEYQQIYLKWYGSPAPYWTNRRILTASGILLLAIACGMGFWRYVSISRINAELVRSIAERKRAEEIISNSLKEKDVMLKEIYHRVKNNLQVICSLLSIQEESIDDKKTQALFDETRTRVYSMAMVHEKLYQSDDLAHIDFRDYLQSLVQEISGTYKRSDVQLSVNSKSLPLDVNTGIPCGLIVNELITNSLKYAFPNGRKGVITVGISNNSEGNYVLTVSDNGIGFPESMDFRKSATLGLQLVNMLTRQLGGTIGLSRSEGTSFSITFPPKNEKSRS